MILCFDSRVYEVLKINLQRISSEASRLNYILGMPDLQVLAAQTILFAPYASKVCGPKTHCIQLQPPTSAPKSNAGHQVESRLYQHPGQGVSPLGTLCLNDTTPRWHSPCRPC